MRVRGILTCLALSAALSAVSPSAQAASKPRPTPVNPLKTLKMHWTCTKTAYQGTKLCLRVELKQVTNAKKQKMTYVTIDSYETRLATHLAIAFAGKTTDNKDQVLLICRIGIGACASMLPNADKYTQVRAELVDKKQSVMLQTSPIHLPLR